MTLFHSFFLSAQRHKTATQRVLDRARSLYREQGPRQFLASLGCYAARRVGIPLGKRADFLRQKAHVDRQFDERLGTDTGGVQNLFNMTIAGSNALHGGTHVAVDPAEFADAIHDLNIDPANFTFIDLGSGKGRALLLAAEAGFRQIIGVEFALELHQIATANVAAFRAEHPVLADRIHLVHADATTFAFPPGPLVIFLFNPFDAVICRQVAHHLMQSWTTAPRPLHLFYMYPVEAETWLQNGWRLTRRTKPYALLQPA